MENKENNTHNNKSNNSVPQTESKNHNQTNGSLDCPWDFNTESKNSDQSNEDLDYPWDLSEYYAQVIPFSESGYNKESIDANLVQGLTGFAITDLDTHSSSFIDSDVHSSNYFLRGQGRAIYCQIRYGISRNKSVSRFVPLY
ncbi:MAG: hypothetical protein GY928_35120 [Colwellia sp.]|nr:hypothetical protein [Colwellia sp.]